MGRIMSDSLLSVILIAKKNTSLSFLRALQSILHQIYSPIKVLVVDANEPNSMYSLGLQEDLVAFPRAEYLQLDQSLSIAAIRNYVIDYVEGEYIAFLNSTDVWDSTKALLQLQQLKADSEAVASCSNGVLIDERREEVSVTPLIEHLTVEPSKWLLDNPAKMSAQVIYQREAVKAEGGFDEQFENFCDGDMLIRLSKNNKVQLLPVSLCECHITQDNDIYDRVNFRDSQKILYKYMEIFLPDRRMSQDFYARMLHLAKMNYQWLNYAAYLFMYFIKGPGRSILAFFIKGAKIISYIFKWIWRELSIVKEGVRILKNIILVRMGKLDKIKALKPAAHIEKAVLEPVVFSSAGQYNERNSLDYVFNHRLESILIPEYVTVIKRGMFYGCDRLVSVEIPNTVLEIQDHAFHGCGNLRHVIVKEGSSLGKIGAYAFAGCGALEGITLPSSVIQIGKYAFAECPSLKQLLFTYLDHGEERTKNSFPTAIGRISRYTFAGCTNLLSVEFGVNSMLEAVDNGAFIGCGRLQRVVLTGSVKTLGSYAFAYCKELETVAIPQVDMLKSIGKCAFMYCQSLEYFQFPNQIEHIYVRTFYGCSGLRLVKIPKKVLSINHQAFAKCTSLANAIILTGDITISPTAFGRNTKVSIPEKEKL